MGRRFVASSSKQAKNTPESSGAAGPPKPLPLSPKSNWVTNVQALKGMGAAKVGESFDEEAQGAKMRPIKRLAEEETATEDKKIAKEGNSAAQQYGVPSKKSAKRAKKQSKTKTSSPITHDISTHTTSVAAAAVALEDENNHSNVAQAKPTTPIDPPKGKPVSQINAAAVLSVLASTSPRSLSSPKADTEEAKSPQAKKGEKRGGNFKWFRKSRKDKDHSTDGAVQGQKSPRTPLFGGLRNPTSPSEAPKMASPVFTSPLRMQLWIGAVQQAIVKVEAEPKQEDELVREEPEMMMQPPIQNPSSFYRHTVDTGVYVDYSTFDDGDSVSSIYLLFKWLTCRDITADPKPTHIQSDNTQVDSDVSFDADAQPRRRVLFSP